MGSALAVMVARGLHHATELLRRQVLEHGLVPSHHGGALVLLETVDGKTVTHSPGEKLAREWRDVAVQLGAGSIANMSLLADPGQMAAAEGA